VEAEAALKAVPATPVSRLDDVMCAIPQAVERYRSMVATWQEAPIGLSRPRNELRALMGRFPSNRATGS
jgi:hypothetical protein